MKKKSCRIGLMGGTFDPPHFGHLVPVQQAAAEYHLDQVWFIPAFISPHKVGEKTTDPFHRSAMLALALQPYPAFRLRTIELSRGRVSYTIETIRELKRQIRKSDRLFFILGADSFLELGSWRNPADLLRSCDLIIINRGTVEAELKKTLEQLETQFRIDLSSSVHFASTSYLPISSTQIRSLLQKGKSVSNLVPSEIEIYIQRNHLYGRR